MEYNSRVSYANPTPEQLERSRKYRREWYYRNREAAKKRTYQNKVETIRRNKERINEIRRSTPCTDCGLSWPHYVMDFDHVQGGKIGNVMVMVNKGESWRRLEAEIAKCELVCANCHRKRTYERLLAEGQEPDTIRI